MVSGYVKYFLLEFTLLDYMHFEDRESMATTIPLPELYPKAQVKSLEGAIWELESEILSMK